jgi:hypothetical protein
MRDVVLGLQLLNSSGRCIFVLAVDLNDNEFSGCASRKRLKSLAGRVRSISNSCDDSAVGAGKIGRSDTFANTCDT